MKDKDGRKRILASLAVTTTLFLAGAVLGQGPPGDGVEARRQRQKELVQSIVGTSRERTRILTTADGYLRFLMAPPGTHFAVEPGKPGTPQETAGAFLGAWWGLFANRSASIGFQVVKIDRAGSGTYVRYQQTYGGVKVFDGEIIVYVGPSGGIEAVISDIMRDTQAIDGGGTTLEPKVGEDGAQKRSLEFMQKRYPRLNFKSTRAEQMVFAPSIVGNRGMPQLVWRIEVGDVDGQPVRDAVFVSAMAGNIVFHHHLIEFAGRSIWDYEGRTYNPIANVRVEGQDPCGIRDVDRAYDYLGDANDFYHQENQRDFSTLIAKVNYGEWNAWWDGTFMIIGEGCVTDDTVGHELTHGVANLTDYGESAAIEESLCDMWGEWIDQRYDHPTGEPNEDNDSYNMKWYLFEDDVNFPNGPCFRSMKNPPDYNHPDRLYGQYWVTTDPCGYDFTHNNAGVGNKLCYLLTDGDSFNGYTISGLGISMAADLFYECMTHLLPSSADYHDFGCVLQLAAVTTGLSDQQRQSVENACKAVEIYVGQALFEVWGSSGRAAWFDDAGNLFLTGTLTVGIPATPGTGDFSVRSYDPNYPSVIYGSTGNMCIQGTLHEGQSSLSPPSWSFVVKTAAGTIVAYIDTSGNVYLKKKLYQRQ